MNKGNKKTKGTIVPFVSLIAIGGLILLDQLTKLWVLKNLRPLGQVVAIPGVLNLTYVENTGAAFGIFKDKTFMLGIISSVLLLGLVVYMLFGKVKNTMVISTLVLITAGGFGNVIDRFTRGFVVDFFDLNFPPFINFPVFNVADIFVTVGATLLMLYILFSKDDILEGEKSNE